MLLFSLVMFWTHDHEAILCREVFNVNPYTTKKGSTQRRRMWDNLNKFTVPKFRVDKRSVRDHVGILVYKHNKKLLAEEKATGITPDEPTELENLLDMIIALGESGEAELLETQGTASKKRQCDWAKAEDVRLKAMKKLSETKKREVHQRMKAMTNRSVNEEVEVTLSNKAQTKHFLDFLKWCHDYFCERIAEESYW